MSQLDQKTDSKKLPKPITLTPDQLSKIAAGTGGALPAAWLRPIIAGGIPIGPVWEASAAGLATAT
jgi:hypothetical protein